MPSEPLSGVKFDIGHVLFIDIVGYSKLLITEQSELLETLKKIVRGTAQVRVAEAEGKLMRLPTGDGGALVFRNTPEAPVLCALEIANELKKHPELRVRIGIHSGPVNEVTDLNAQANIAGAGINIAQRVMDCGDAGHILLSKHVADDLEHYPRWQPHLHDLGECDVKHGIRLCLVNLYADGIGNPQLPKRFQALKKQRVRTRWTAIAAALLLLAAIIAAFVVVSKRGGTKSVSTAPEKSIAVLPFENLSRDPDNAYFSEGIQNEILTRLAKIADLKVISRTSTQRYQSKPANLSEIAAQLGVANILEGSVQRAADQVRVNVQLVNVQTGSPLWAETYDRKLTDIFSVESEIARRIAESLQARLSGREEQALAAKPTNNPEAYDAYLRGLAFEARSNYSSDAIFKAIDFYGLAVQLDPNFALAWARLSGAHALLYFNRGYATDARRDAAKEALENAQRLQPNSPEILLFLGYYQYWVLRDYGLAKATFRRVGKMLPGDSAVLYALGAVARREGNWEESVAYWERGLALDPRNPALLTEVAFTYAVLRQFPAALKLYDQALDILPNEPSIMALKASIYQAEGKLQEAAKSLVQVNAETNSNEAIRIKLTQLRLERNYTETTQFMQARQARLPFTAGIDKGIKQVGVALAQRLTGDPAQAKATAEQARNTLEPLRKNQPDNAFIAAALAVAYATLDEKGLALNEAQRAITLVPSSKDRVSGPGFGENLALIETMIGENSRAISTLTQLLQTPYGGWLYTPSPITPALLRLDPIWDPLRADPAFQKLCEQEKE
jgi:TolB-like protein/Tfp pilus assembly protein PilF